MKDKIRLLPERVANQIAAGEVVTHPASVIKEMMENAMDAGATDVIVNYRRAGYDLIQIVDNGCGMTPNDARMAFDRHATSKIKSAKDIYALNTFGFRGEALASIAAVAKVELRTRTAGAAMGTMTIVESGVFIEQQQVMCEEGSQFFVREIFQNIPARRRFLERDSKSATSIKSEFRRVVLCNPEISFSLYGDDAPIYKLSPTTLAGRIVDVVGRNIKKNLLEVKANTVIVNIHGYIGHPDTAKKSNADQYMFANGRYFESPALYKAILRGYDKIIKGDKLSPSFFLFFEIAPDSIDINIHPQKTEIKFSEESAIWSILVAAIRESLARTGVIPMMEFDSSSSIEIPVAQRGVAYAEPRAITNESYNPFEIESEREPMMPSDEVEYDFIDSSAQPIAASKSPSKAKKGRGSKVQAMTLHESYDSSWEDGFETFESEAFQSVTPRSTHNPIAEYDLLPSTDIEVVSSSGGWDNIDIEDETIDEAAELPLTSPESQSEMLEVGNITVTNGTFAWCKIGASMTVVDLRRAKERILYDHYSSTMQSGESVSQHILFPITMRFSDVEYAQMEQSLRELTSVGFDLTLLGAGDVELRGLPADISTDMAEKLIYELLHLLSTPENIAQERRERVAATMARGGAQSIGRNVSPQQAKELITQLLKSGNSARTAGGKEIMWSVTREDIKKKLK